MPARKELARGFGTVLLAMTILPVGAQAVAAQTGASSQAANPGPTAATPGESTIAPFSAHYTADWKTINIGTSDLELKPDAGPGSYVYTWTITARGVFRIVYSNDVVQKSWFSVLADHVRPQKYTAAEGTSAVNVDFDWETGHARGTSEKKPIDLKLHDGTQDVMSIQVEVMLDLKNGNLPGTFRILDKDEIKDFVYTQEGPVRLRTALGELDTVVVSSQRTGNNRVLRMWFAPSLGYVPVQAERSRDGKLEFAMRIKTLKR
jgi:hypothetical protein